MDRDDIRRHLPRAVSTAPMTPDEMYDVLPECLRELERANTQRREKDKDRLLYWNGYQLALGDVWKCIKHLYGE
jgi:uncharacterized Zn ribbon protein